MLTPEDIKLMEQVFPTRDEIVLKTEFLALRGDVRTLQTSIDGLAKLVKDFRDEHIVLYKRIETLENWAKKVAEKLGISLSF
jgi:prophage DNA circulation protein